MNADANEIRETANFWRSKVDQGALNAGERAEFERWMTEDPDHARAYAEAELLWKALGELEYDETLRASAVKEKCSYPLARPLRPFGRPPHWRLGVAGPFAGIAAVIAASVAAGFMVFSYYDAPSTEKMTEVVATATVHETGRGVIEKIALADGTTIILGAKSRIEVALSDARRDVRLAAGAAFFDVARDPARPFIVRSDNARVEVTGTAFDLQRKGGALHVAVEEGEVNVSHPVAVGRSADPEASLGRLVSTIALTAGEGIVASREDGLGKSFDVRRADIGAWREGQLVFFRATLAEIADDANRYAETPIVVDDQVRDLRMTLTVEAGDTSGLLAMLERAAPVRVVARKGVQSVEPRN